MTRETVVLVPPRLLAWAQRVLDICSPSAAMAGTCPCSRCRNPYQPAPGLCWRWAHASNPWAWHGPGYFCAPEQRRAFQDGAGRWWELPPPRCLEWLPRGGRVRPRSGGRWHACADPPASVRRDWVPRCAPC